MSQFDYEITYEKGNGKTRKKHITREEGQLDCPGCGQKEKIFLGEHCGSHIDCECGTTWRAKKAKQELYKAFC